MNIKTSLNTAALAFDSIKNLGTDLNPATLAAYNTQLSGLTATQQKMALSTTNLTLAQQKQVLSYIAETAAAKSLTAQQIAELSIDQKQALIKAGLITQEQIETGATLELSKAQLQKIITSDAISTKDKELILGAFGVTGANLTETSSWEVLGASIKKATAAMLKWLFLTPAGWATLAITAIAGTIVAYNKWGDTLENNRKKLEELKSEAQTISSDLQTFNSELQTTQQRISELESKGNLTFTEAEELENLRKQNNELQRSIDLLKLKEKENNKGKNKTFVKTMQKNVDVEDERVQTGRLNPDDTAETEMITEAELIERKFNTLDELQEKLRHASTETEKKAIQEQIDKITKYLSECNEQYIEDAEGIDYIQNPTTEDDKKVNEWLDYINDFQDKMAIAMGGDNAKENAFNRLVDNWKFDEVVQGLQDLGKEGKVTAEMLKNPAYDAFLQKLIDIEFISDDTEGSLRFVASAFNGTMQSAEKYLESLDAKDEITAFVDNIEEEAKALGTTSRELSELTSKHIILNNTKLSLEDKISQIERLGIIAGWSKGKIAEVIELMNRASGNVPSSLVLTDGDRSGSAQLALYNMFGGWKKIDTDVGGDTPPYSPSGGDKGSGKDNTPDYEDPTEAIINRINLRADELAQQEEEIQNLIEISELENDYKKQISLTNDLIATRKRRVEELNAANTGLHNKAQAIRDANPWDEESWFDSQGNATEAYYDLYNSSSKTNQEKIKNVFESISKIKKAWVDNDKEIVDLNKELLQDAENLNELYASLHENTIRDIEYARDMALEANPFADTTSYYKQMQDAYHKEAERLRALDPEKYKEDIQELQLAWWDAHNAIVDWRWENSNNWINDRNTYNDWSLFDDSEIDAWERVVKWLKEEYPNDIDKIKEAEQSLFEARKEQFTKANDFGSSVLDSRKTILQSYFDVTNSIAEAHHEINKELDASKTMYEYLDEDTRKLLFNQEDWNVLSEGLYDIQYRADKLQRQYQYDLENSTLDTIEEITSNYKMQYETLMKSYEIAKADLEIAKKKQKLDNVLNERNVRMRINGEWQYVAKTQDVIDAKAELADAEYAKRVEESGLTQQESINNLTKQQNELTTVINKFESGVISLDEAVLDAVNAIGYLPSALATMYSNVSTNTARTNSGSSVGGSSGGRILQVGADGKAPSGAKLGDTIRTAGGDYKIVTAATPGATFNSSSGHYSIKVKEKHANGTRYTPGGLTELGEVKDEMFITNNGHFIPINQPTLGNIGAGGIVFNQDQMDFTRKIWDWSNIGTIPNANISNIVNRQMGETNTYQMYGNMIFDGNNPEEIFRKMADFFKNTRYKSN